MEIKIINVPYLGDLYRFYVADTGEILEVRCYAFMLTAYKVLDAEQIPDEVVTLFESKYLS